ncbi:MAG: flagellar biosynthetic protein FliP [Alphaproteobacteria bacterium]|jgi:flagellar biosynthetic protein FliP
MAKINHFFKYCPLMLGVALCLCIFGYISPVAAQSVSVDFGQSFTLSTNIIQFFVLLTVLSIAPGIIMMITCFPFMVTVLSILRQAMGVPQTPPNMMIMSLAMFLTFYVMQPTFEKAWNEGLSPYMEGTINEQVAFDKTVRPLRDFMEQRVSIETSSFMQNLSSERDPLDDEIKLSVLIPAYMITEIERAFKVGFLIFIPFVIIDLVVAALLMSMGMMMLPPASVSLPIKLAFFTLSNGWSLLATALVKSYTE